jgi:hypothetical protein
MANWYREKNSGLTGQAIKWKAPFVPKKDFTMDIAKYALFRKNLWETIVNVLFHCHFCTTGCIIKK